MQQSHAGRSELSLASLGARARTCTLCPLSETRSHVVFGEGNALVPVMFVGEGPGDVEDQTGRPFVGPAGQKLDDVLSSVEIRREDVYITNVVKCRPPGNRVPSRAEMETCCPFLESQIALLKPNLIVTLGNTSTQWLMPEIPGITKSHGSFFSWRGDIQIFPMFHPSYLLRNPSREKGSPKYLTWKDIQKVSQWIHEYQRTQSG
jgi:uracil-DNA glycosylase